MLNKSRNKMMLNDPFKEKIEFYFCKFCDKSFNIISYREYDSVPLCPACDRKLTKADVKTSAVITK